MRTLLISAYACEPLKGSEQGVGWNWVLQMAKKNKLHVITRANNQEIISKHLPEELAKNISFHYYDTGSFIRHFKNKAKGLYFYYFIWQLGIIPIIRKLIKTHTFDYSIHITFGSIWMPTFLPFFNVPFIWGPVGGGDGEPQSFIKILPYKQRVIQWIRLLMKKTAFLNPFILISSFRAKSILLRSKDSINILPKNCRSKASVIIESAIEPHIFNFTENKLRSNGKIHLISTGRLMPSKNIICAVRSLMFVPDHYNISYTIIGSGSEKNKIENEIQKYNQQNRIRIISEIPRIEVLNALSQADIFLFPSLREGGSWALMEAMTIGLPVICLKWSGMEIVTDDNCAVRLPVTNPEQMPKDMAAAIRKLIDDQHLRKKMGLEGKARIKKEFNWDSKGEFMEKLFDDLDKKFEK